MNLNIKKQIIEVNIIRPLLICVLLIMYHAFAPFGDSEAWNIEGVSRIEAYYWLDKFVYSFMLESFVFISGYVFAFQIAENKVNSFKVLLIGKVRRLIIPSVVFSILYAIFFYDKQIELMHFIYDILNGLGHMWFLPMLFWCFLAAFFIEKIKVRELLKLVLLFLLSLFSFFPLPFQLGQTCYYLFFFYAAMIVFHNKERLVNSSHLSLTIVVFVSVFFISFVCCTILRERIIAYHPVMIEERIIKMFLYKSTMLIYSSFGVLSFYLAAIKISRGYINCSCRLLLLNKLCMGIYIAHQFILMSLYFHTDISILVNPYWLPWAGYVIALVLSTLFAYLVRLTPIGRWLI